MSAATENVEKKVEETTTPTVEATENKAEQVTDEAKETAESTENKTSTGVAGVKDEIINAATEAKDEFSKAKTTEDKKNVFKKLFSKVKGVVAKIN